MIAAMRRRSARLHLLLGVTSGLGLGCMAEPQPSRAVEAPASETPVTETPMPPDPEPTPTPTPEPATCAIPESPLRRLSHFEYGRTLEVLFPSIEIPTVSLPLDSRPHEFDNDAEAMQATIALVEGYNDIARTVAERALPTVLSCTPATPDEEAVCARGFVETQGRRLFRRPLTESQIAAYSAPFTSGPTEATFAQRAQLALQAMLSAPELLYRLEQPAESLEAGASGRLDPWSLASRLSFFLWGSGPDDTLLAAAASGALDTPEGLRAEAERLLGDPRAEEAFEHFFSQWMDLERIDGTTKADADGLDAALRASMKEESRRLVKRLFASGGMAELLTTSTTEVDARLAALYGVEAPAEGWAEVELSDRAGLLGHASFLASHGHPDKPSPVLRGVFVLERLLCTSFGAPPANAAAAAASAEQGVSGPLTNRELYQLMTAQGDCAGCHESINAVGFAFEGFDTMGRTRTEEPNGLPLDTSGVFGSLSFGDAGDLVTQLAADPRVQSCATRKWVRYAFGGGPMETASCVVSELESQGAAGFRDLILATVTHPAFSTFTMPSEAL